MVKVGLLSAWQTSAGVKPSVGCTDWVHDDKLFSVEVCSFEMSCSEEFQGISFFILLL